MNAGTRHTQHSWMLARRFGHRQYAVHRLKRCNFHLIDVNLVGASGVDALESGGWLNLVEGTQLAVPPLLEIGRHAHGRLDSLRRKTHSTRAGILHPVDHHLSRAPQKARLLHGAALDDGIARFHIYVSAGMRRHLVAANGVRSFHTIERNSRRFHFHVKLYLFSQVKIIRISHRNDAGLAARSGWSDSDGDKFLSRLCRCHGKEHKGKNG